MWMKIRRSRATTGTLIMPEHEPNYIEIIHLDDLDATLVMSVYDYWVKFMVHQIVQNFTDDPANVHGREWQIRGSATSPNATSSLADAEIFISGSVKWDGCSNWDMMPEEDRPGYFHGCSREHLTNIGEIMARCWDLTAKHCPNWI